MTATSAPPSTRRTALRVATKAEAADGVVALTLVDPGGGRLPDWTPGSHIDLLLPTGEARQYSLCGDRWDARSYRVAVRREDLRSGGRGGSSWVHDVLAVGDLVEVGGPRNHFRLHPAEDYLFIAGGIGITPLLPMVEAARRLGARWRLVCAGRTRASMPFLDELAELADSTAEQDDGERLVVVARDERERLDLESLLGGLDARTRVYACGPAPLLDAVARHCPPGQLRTERFSAAEPPTPVRDAPFTVVLQRSGAQVEVARDVSVLEAVRSAGAAVLSSCREGTCGTCETGVLGGVPDHRDSVLDEAARERGDCMLVCVSRSCSDRLVLDL
ncbi:MAG: PDR/VanB family oxidoreductase [Quadrisphaera sp.]